MATKNHIIWPERAITPETIIIMSRVVLSHMRKFEVLRDDERQLLISDLDFINLRQPPSAKIDLSQLISLRNILSIQENMNASRQPPNMNDYFATCDLDTQSTNKADGNSRSHRHLEIVQRACRLFAMPPMYVLFKYMSHNGLHYKKVRENNPEEYLAVVDWANETDSNSRLHKLSNQNAGELFERSLERHLRKLGLKFRTQEDLVAEQRQMPDGRAYATPDILFDQPVEFVVGDKIYRVTWIDAKNYIYAPICSDLNRINTDRYRPSFIDESIVKQNDKYNKHFGPGAFVFAYGWAQLTYPDLGGAIFLSGQHIKRAAQAETTKSHTIKFPRGLSKSSDELETDGF